MGQRGEAMSLVTMKKTITQTTRLTLGLLINPHLFRACAATTAALQPAAIPIWRVVCSSTSIRA
jgi:hypothetical protein